MEKPGDLLVKLLADHDEPERAARVLAKNPQSLYLPWREHLRSHELRSLDRFGEAYALLEALQVACLAVGAMFDRDHVQSAREEHEPRVNVLRQLWAASVNAGAETIALLRAGYPGGALARYRLVREAEVLSTFLMTQPVGVSQQYLDHASLKVVMMKGDVQRWSRWTKDEPFSSAEMRGMGSEVGSVLASHPHWKGEYGWAHEPLLDSDADYRRAHRERPRTRGPSFADLEAAVGQRPWKLWWVWASRSVHVNLDTTGEELPLPGQVEDLGTPAARLAESLATPTTMLVCSWPTPPEAVEEYSRFAWFLHALARLAEEKLGEIEATPEPG